MGAAYDAYWEILRIHQPQRHSERPLFEVADLRGRIIR
jgi:hypothetical protein